MTSTTAATLSASMRVTMPGNRLRADWATIGRSVDALAALIEQPAHLADLDQALAALGALHPEAALGLPASERLDRDLEHLGGLADAQASGRLFVALRSYRGVSAFVGDMSRSSGACTQGGWREGLAERCGVWPLRPACVAGANVLRARR